MTFVGYCSASCLALFGTRHCIGAVDQDGSQKKSPKQDQMSDKKTTLLDVEFCLSLEKPWKVMRRRKGGFSETHQVHTSP